MAQKDTVTPAVEEEIEVAPVEDEVEVAPEIEEEVEATLKRKKKLRWLLLRKRPRLPPLTTKWTLTPNLVLMLNPLMKR